MFSAYRQSTKNSCSLLLWSIISFSLRYTVLRWLLKWFGPPHFKQDFPQAGHSFLACVVPHLLQLCPLLPFRAPRPREQDCLPPVEARFVFRRFVLSASTCCSSILAAPFIRPSVGLASVRVAATLLARDFQWRILFCLRSCYLVQQIRKAEKVFVAELEIRQMFGPRSSSSLRTDTWIIQFVYGPLTRPQT